MTNLLLGFILLLLLWINPAIILLIIFAVAIAFVFSLENDDEN